MIKFFRKIRQQLLTENKFSKYLLYAIGEILLVVIGILIALSINNWNQEQKQEAQEINFLKSLQTDLSNDLEYFNKEIERTSSAAKDQKNFISKIYEKQETIENVRALFTLLDLDTKHLTIQNPTYLELISSGNLNIFRNEKLKLSLINYYRISEELGKRINEYNLVSVEYMLDMDRTARNNIKFWAPDVFNDPKMFISGEWNYINDPSSAEFLAIQNVAYIYADRNSKHLKYFVTLKSKSSELISQINMDLRSRE